MEGQVRRKISEDLRLLDSFQLSEVNDFVEFLQYRGRTASHDPYLVDRIRGKYRETLAPSTDFAQRKHGEIETEDLKWQPS